ncbi:MAG: hypothetical protein RBQ66_05355 [Candidatus Cloacimonadaceae bacterium]|nr:hypothetical protein [Candidatus Cloacimonadaceae bacterium]
MKIGYTVFYVFESARLQGEIPCRYSGINASISCRRAFGHIAWMLLNEPPPLGCQAPAWRGDGVALRSELRSLWQTELATPFPALCSPVWAATPNLPPQDPSYIE